MPFIQLQVRFYNLHLTYLLWASQVVLVIKNPPANARDIRDVGSIPALGRSPGGEHGNPLQYSCLENPTDRGTQWATVYRVAKSQTQLKQLSTHYLLYRMSVRRVIQLVYRYLNFKCISQQIEDISMSLTHYFSMHIIN